jgi:hypothetical protein
MIRDNIHDDCPTNDFEVGEPNGGCMGDGHYMCDECKHFRNDFHKDKEFREMVMSPRMFYLKTYDIENKTIWMNSF